MRCGSREGDCGRDGVSGSGAEVDNILGVFGADDGESGSGEAMLAGILGGIGAIGGEALSETGFGFVRGLVDFDGQRMALPHSFTYSPKA
jgi:hypothetical protein